MLGLFRVSYTLPCSIQKAKMAFNITGSCELQHANRVLMAYANSKVKDQTAYSHIPLRAVAFTHTMRQTSCMDLEVSTGTDETQN